jgi:hypothetical protein
MQVFGTSAASQGAAAASQTSSTSSPATASSTPPTITIAGNNPAHINIGDTYQDIGATAKQSAGHDLGVKTFLNGALVSNIVLDTTQAATDTIDYGATDTNGLTSTSTRTVIIDAAPRYFNSGSRPGLCKCRAGPRHGILSHMDESTKQALAAVGRTYENCE